MPVPFDVSKRLCDCTLGEYLAAERSLAITTQWVVALVTVCVTLIGRRLWMKRQERKARKQMQELPELFSDPPPPVPPEQK